MENNFTYIIYLQMCMRDDLCWPPLRSKPRLPVLLNYI